GSPHIAQFVKDHSNLLKCLAAIWEEGGIDPHGSPNITLGARGLLSVELYVKVLSRDAHSGSAHILPNAAWRLVRALESLKGPDEHIRIAGFYDRAKPMSTTDKQWFDALPNNETFLREQFGVKDFVHGLTGSALRYAVFEPTCNIQGIFAGYQGQ